VIEAVALDDFKRNSERGGKASRGEDLAFGPVQKHLAVFQKYDAVDFRDDVVEVVRNKEKTHAGLREVAELLTNFAERWKVEAGGGFVEQQSVGVVNQCAGDEKAARFTGRQLVEPAICQVRDFKASHSRRSGGFHFR